MTIAPPAPPLVPDAVPAPPARPGARVIAIAMIALGAVLVVGTVVWTGIAAAGGLSIRTSERTTSAEGIDRLRLDIAAADVRIEFVPVERVELEVTGRHGADRWTLDTTGDELVVASGDNDVDLMFDRGDRAVLRLPQDLADLDADIVVTAGDLSADGEFGALTLDIDAADAEIRGAVRSLDASVEAADLDASLRDVETASFTASTGDVTATLTGAQPARVTVDADAADVEIEVPTGRYRLTGDATDSDLVETDLISSADATSTIDVRSSFADVTISASR